MDFIFCLFWTRVIFGGLGWKSCLIVIRLWILVTVPFEAEKTKNNRSSSSSKVICAGRDLAQTAV